VQGTYERVNGQNIVTSLDVIPNTASERSGGTSGGQ
jgi:hypothetical protein